LPQQTIKNRKNMKKLFIITLALGLLVSCKKSENDPGLTFRSRDKKIVGEWTIESAENFNIAVNGANKTETTTKYAGSTITTTITTGSNSNPTVGTVSLKGVLNIEKNGKLKYTETSTTGAITATKTFNGNWSWGNSKRNKTHLILSFPLSYNSSLMPKTALSTEFRYEIDELRAKKMVLKSDYSSSSQQGTTSSQESNVYTINLTK
jgi:hypothetical protein